MDTSWTIYESPLGPLTLVAGTDGLSGLRFPARGGPLDEARRDPGAFTDAIAQLEEYFAGRRKQFNLALELGGTAFQRRVWDALSAIPYGATRSYTSIAEAIDRPDRVRAVAAAVGRTPVPIIVPCHRAVAASGALTGYLGGLHRKRALLDLEAVHDAGGSAPRQGHGRQLTLIWPADRRQPGPESAN
jgi:methylated-DNA-[protein]-cysteine S-methyltransferase